LLGAAKRTALGLAVRKGHPAGHPRQPQYYNIAESLAFKAALFMARTNPNGFENSGYVPVNRQTPGWSSQVPEPQAKAGGKARATLGCPQRHSLEVRAL
jgi:hypothetical protein